MGEEGEELNVPLLASSSSPYESDDNPIKRTVQLQLRSTSDHFVGFEGTFWTAVAHVITGVIGAGVLSLAWSIAQLGWIAGPLAIVAFAGITVVSTFLLCDCYRSPDPENGLIRNSSYMLAVRYYLGETSEKVCTIFVQESFYGIGIAYVITSAVSMRAIQKSNCYHSEGHEAPCSYGETGYMILFGAVQIIMSQTPDFHKMEWLSIVAAIMSFTYSFIGLALGFAKVIENGTILGSITGVEESSILEKLCLAFQALGDIAFAYPYSIICLEIQDTLRSPPPENQTMKKASLTAIVVTTLFYLLCGGFGYAAFGSDTPGNLLTGFGFYEPYWLIDFANACVVLHLVGGYQIYSQPVFASIERWFSWKYPESRFVNNYYDFKLPFLPVLELNLLKLCSRTVYVVSTTILAIIFPYFNEVLGVLGALNFWPLAIYFPMEMYFVQRKVARWTRKWIALQCFSIFCLVVSIVGFVGSLEQLISERLSS
ncbi:Amino acid transporter, transmembrane domain [Dillenia turbinata]|uniref:Amino acid transporter, transmembrane domain n=1 Tax=Dillenia turbinata TaxID=194707 RepID=A0AAN8VRD2_9MAGN